MIERGEIYWVDPGPASGSAPAKVRPIVVVQDDHFNRSRLATVIAAAVSSDTSLAHFPGNVFLPAGSTGLPRDSVVNVTALVTVEKKALVERAGRVPAHLLVKLDEGLRTVLAV